VVLHVCCLSAFWGGGLNLLLGAIQVFKEHLLNLIRIWVQDNSLSLRSWCLEMSEEQLMQSIIPIAFEIVLGIVNKPTYPR
jgi:hypothetical protein